MKLIEAEKLRRQAEIKIRDIIDNLEKQTGLNVAVYGSNKEGARVDLEWLGVYTGHKDCEDIEIYESIRIK